MYVCMYVCTHDHVYMYIWLYMYMHVYRIALVSIIFVSSFVRSFIHSFFRWFVHPFVRSFIHSFNHVLIGSSIYLFVCSTTAHSRFDNSSHVIHRVQPDMHARWADKFFVVLRCLRPRASLELFCLSIDTSGKPWSSTLLSLSWQGGKALCASRAF